MSLKNHENLEHFGVNSIFDQFLGWLRKVRNVFKVWKSVWFKYNPVERVPNQFWISLTKFRWFVLTFLDLLIWPFRPFQLFLAVLARKWSICLLNINSKNQTFQPFIDISVEFDDSTYFLPAQNWVVRPRSHDVKSNIDTFNLVKMTDYSKNPDLLVNCILWTTIRFVLARASRNTRFGDLGFWVGRVWILRYAAFMSLGSDLIGDEINSTMTYILDVYHA